MLFSCPQKQTISVFKRVKLSHLMYSYSSLLLLFFSEGCHVVHFWRWSTRETWTWRRKLRQSVQTFKSQQIQEIHCGSSTSIFFNLDIFISASQRQGFMVYSHWLSPRPGSGPILCRNHSHWLCLGLGLDI